MFDSIFTSTGTTLQLSTNTSILSIVVAIVLGFFIACVYLFSFPNNYSRNFAITLTVLPALVAIVIMLVGSDVARAFSLAGVFSLVRFRSVPGDSKDITIIFFAMAIGLACGMGTLLFAAVIAVFISIVLFVLFRSNFAKTSDVEKELKITIPENLNFAGTFDAVFDEFTKNVKLKSVKTTNMGTMFELTYAVEMKCIGLEKEFMDAIRCRNGNLNIVFCQLPNRQQEGQML